MFSSFHYTDNINLYTQHQDNSRQLTSSFVIFIKDNKFLQHSTKLSRKPFFLFFYKAAFLKSIYKYCLTWDINIMEHSFK